MEGTHYIGKHEGNVTCQGFIEDGGQSGKCKVGAGSDARNGAVGEDKNRSDGVDVLFDLSRNAFLVELVLLKTASVGQPRCVKNADLGKWLCIVSRSRSRHLPLCHCCL